MKGISDNKRNKKNNNKKIKKKQKEKRKDFPSYSFRLQRIKPVRMDKYAKSKYFIKKNLKKILIVFLKNSDHISKDVFKNNFTPSSQRQEA